MVEEEGGSIREKQILVGGVDGGGGGEAEKKDRVGDEAANRNTQGFSFKPRVLATEHLEVVDRYDMNSSRCKCRVTKCEPFSGSGPDRIIKATIMGCEMHHVAPQVMYRHPGSWSRQRKEDADRRTKMMPERGDWRTKMMLEKKREVEQSIRSNKIRCNTDIGVLVEWD